MSSLYTPRTVHRRGRGYFAIQNIKKGTQIFEEAPLIFLAPDIKIQQHIELMTSSKRYRHHRLMSTTTCIRTPP